ncbi:SMP-30/gluconolactonase/LRE family protein [Zunongwangia sp. F363]|uniref:SMP-30/gluconolactonase/LRE family protein n=1 Tax=Autumnicola tepida TaxID=3075595 RepID=A0ABU3CAB3_9FLAO|nr:SMP-30/gluconolactonase/LRE family protein [Zunongwangia sp. F363]MDT0643261.1 SMP-30/gluconolactonase/LRE family protein [Zunongwangia sp. F363]
MKKFYILSFSFLACCFYAKAQQKLIISENANLQLVSDEFEFTEGPAADSLGNVFFTDQPNNRILKWDAETGEISLFLEDARRANGLFVDDEGNLLACADENFQLIKISPKKQIEVLVGSFKGKNLNGPNDLWLDKKGGIYFTDPYYQREYWEREQPDLQGQNVYYLARGEKDPVIVAKDLKKPNGIIGTADGKKLYIADIGDNKTYSYTVSAEGKLTDKTLFVEQGSDGMTIDENGNVYLTGDGVTVYNKNGEKIEHIKVGEEWTANVTFGGKDQQTLFITAMDAVYTLKMKLRGTRWQP